MSSKEVVEVDPVRLGQAGLNALALAGAAIVAHYAAAPDEQLPDDVGEVLHRALAAFADPREFDASTVGGDAQAAIAMVEHARSHAGQRSVTAVGLAGHTHETWPGVA